MEIKCPSCGKDSPLGRVLCMHCGERIHAQMAEGKKGKKAKSGPGIITRFIKGVVGLIRAVITLGLLAALTLALFPQESEGESGSAKDLASYEAKKSEFDGANGSALSHSASFSEAEINAFLAEVVSRENKGEKAAYMLEFDSMVMDLGATAAELMVTLAKGPIKISLALELELNEKQSGYSVVSATIGRLPTGPAKDVVASKVAAMLGALDVEKNTLQRAKQLQLEEGALAIKTH